MIKLVFCVIIIAACACSKCFTKFKRSGKSFCACDLPFAKLNFASSSSKEAFMLCSMRCSQTNNCVAYNYWLHSNDCQLFDGKLRNFSVVPHCHYFFETAHQAGVQFNQSLLTITVDDELSEFYVNGDSVPIQSNFPNANTWKKNDTYDLTGSIYVLAIRSHNVRDLGGLIAKTLDDHILTNSTWKCLKEAYDGWYEVGYDDSSWPAANKGRRNGNLANTPKEFHPAYWITEPKDTFGDSYFYCRKNFIDYINAASCVFDEDYMEIIDPTQLQIRPIVPLK
ncbi:hypothetical protein HELRODRAFT_180253 [Helobdella robusta]|uniref:Apple domain-containing protein n=1 Tax=Helobdella robusta TaxID=6412 RepID=T1FFN1_HELRO|nr:hypothetical protein HELRODRAFT_180253 [Helobdella robusta]ESN94085.1 hypothetical protein HELRODRAFT_180253 [Helobdella robusta]